jgi:ATP-dependent exoDNAse (exonuclease V) alpha subunit
VGDPDQLPSVGAGDVLADLLRSGQFPVTTVGFQAPSALAHAAAALA